jgi:cytochrome c oxidase subunit 4
MSENIATFEPHGRAVAKPFHPVNYFMIFLALVVLTLITVAVALKRFDDEMVNVLMALLIATTKGAFVARYFMHLKFEGKLIYAILLAPVTLAIILVLALIPDIGHGRHTAFNDMVGNFEGMFGGNGAQ